MRKYAKCIDNYDGGNFLTVGRTYEVLGCNRREGPDRLFYVVNDRGTRREYFAEDFQVVGCPCDIKTCVKHRKSAI